MLVISAFKGINGLEQIVFIGLTGSNMRKGFFEDIYGNYCLIVNRIKKTICKRRKDFGISIK